jgi:hypothetical protein
MTTETLQCGCIRGQFLCPEAVRLWAAYNTAYKAAERYPLSNTPEIGLLWYAAYNTRAAYNEHFAPGLPDITTDSGLRQ